VEDNRNAEFELGDEEPINTAADRFAKLAPKMSTMAMISGNEVDRHLVGRYSRSVCRENGEVLGVFSCCLFVYKQEL